MRRYGSLIYINPSTSIESQSPPFMYLYFPAATTSMCDGKLKKKFKPSFHYPHTEACHGTITMLVIVYNKS